VNDSIVDLGEAIFSAYYNKLNEWSALAEITFVKDDLPASFGMVGDILRLEENWQEFGTLVQTLQTDYLPQDLVEASNTEALSTGEQPKTSYSSGKMNDYLFDLLTDTDVYSAFSPGLNEQQEKNKTADNTNRTPPGRGFDFPEIKRTSSAYIGNSDLSAGSSKEPVTGNIPANTTTETGNMVRENIVDSAQTETLLNLDNLNFTVNLPSQQTSVKIFEPDEPDAYSASIWSKPLQGLGDFATQITHASSKHTSENVPSPQPVQPSGNTTNQLSVYSGWLSPGKPDDQTNQGQSLVSGQPTTTDSAFTTPLNSDLVEPLLEAGEIANVQPENQPFQSTIRPHTILPDTDDILEALTDCIYRDFRRYYP
jgi:hypothetical protein